MDSDARASRIGQLFTRGLEAARQAYQAGQYVQEHGHDRQDRVIVGTPLPLAHALLRQGDEEALAAAVVEELLAAQERHPRHPHRGNWPRFVGDEEITDLNSAPFILRWLLPLLMEHGAQLPPELIAQCRESVRLALAEVERLNVAPIYTNIHLMGLFALLAGGQWLDDAHFTALGQQRWAAWVAFTVQSGAPREYNSTAYLGMDLTALAKIQQYVCDAAVHLQARLMYERIWLHAAVHLHRPTGQLGGPHARCYWDGMTTGQERLKEILWRETGWEWALEPGPYGGHPASHLPVSLELALTDFWLPAFVADWLENQARALPCEVRETADAAAGHDLTTYLAPGYTLGLASRTYGIGTNILAIEQMANHLMLYYKRGGRWGMMYSRYVVNDQHWGTLRSFPFRPETNFFDQGHFAGVQSGNKAVALYALLPLNDTYVTSLKTVVAFQSGPNLERVWVNDRAVSLDEAPSLQPGDWLIVEDGAVYLGVRPLEPTCLSREAPILLERGPLGELWLSIYNYRGASRRLWDYAGLGGAYWRGNLRAGFVVEVAEREAYASAAAFYEHLRQAAVADTVDEAHTRTVTYRSDGDELSLSYDLWRTEPKERRLNGAIYRPPRLASPLAVQGDSGELQVGQAKLTTDPQPIWLIAQELDPARRAWIAVNPQDHPTPVRLETPLGVVTAPQWGMGRLEWRAPEAGPGLLMVESLAELPGLQVPEGLAIQYRAPGEPPTQ
jgi:hypothetical protein